MKILFLCDIATWCTLFLQQYREARSKAISALKKLGPHPYPHQFNRTMNLSEFNDRYQDLAVGEQHVDTVSVAGALA